MLLCWYIRAGHEILFSPLPADQASTGVRCSDTALPLYVCLQTTEDGWERKTLHGAAKEEDGERGPEDDEEGAEDRRQAVVTF